MGRTDRVPITHFIMIHRSSATLRPLILPAYCRSRERAEFHAVTQDIYWSGIASRSAIMPAVGQVLTCSIRYVGLFEARVVGTQDHLFVVHLLTSRRRGGEIARTMLALAHEQERPLEAWRLHARINPVNRDVLVTLEDGRVLPGRLINVSASGAALVIEDTVERGAHIVIGSTAARVVRVFRDGIGAAFVTPLDPVQVHPGIRL